MDNTLNYYATNAKSLSHRYESANVKNIHELLLKTFSSDSYLLEIGCGSGRDASFMYQHGYKVVAIDASKEMVYEAKKLHPELVNNLYVKTIPHNLDYEDNSFNGIYSIATLMHLEKSDIEKTIERIYNYLKPGGRFLFSVSTQRDDINDEDQDIYGRHFTTISQENWISICESKGFTTLQVQTSRDGLNRDGIVWLTCIMEKYE